MTTDFRALCAELTEQLAAETQLYPGYERDVVTRARAALAAEPVAPADEEVAQLVADLRSVANALSDEGYIGSVDRCRRAADLLERLASPACVVLKPSPELIAAFKAAGYGRIESMERLAPQPVPEGPSDAELLELSQFCCVSYLLSDGTVVSPFEEGTDMRSDVLSFARAVLARWGRA